MKFSFSERSRKNSNSRGSDLPQELAVLDGASDREIEQVVRKNKNATDRNWDLLASQYGLRR